MVSGSNQSMLYALIEFSNRNKMGKRKFHQKSTELYLIYQKKYSANSETNSLMSTTWEKERRKTFSKRTDSQKHVGIMKPNDIHKIETLAGGGKKNIVEEIRAQAAQM